MQGVHGRLLEGRRGGGFRSKRLLHAGTDPDVATSIRVPGPVDRQPFETASDALGQFLSGCLPTGVGGLAGTRLAGGPTIVQDPVQAGIPAMPQAASPPPGARHYPSTCTGLLPAAQARTTPMTTDPATERAIKADLPEGLVAPEESRRHRQALVDELEALRGELERALRMRDEFMALVAHELRTPLSVLAMEGRVRQHKLAAGDTGFFAPDNLAGMLERDQRQVRGITRLIDDMLDASRIRDGRLAIRPGRCDLAALLRRAVAEARERHDDAAIALETAGVDAVGEWDEFRLEQALVNLLDNALRHGAGKPVRVVLEQRPGAATVRVVDQGPGIAPEDRADAFEPFARLGERGRAGLGLHIARQVVQAHGGAIGIESTPGGGATFSVTLPTAGA
jgi:signal transduction histidine kinase